MITDKQPAIVKLNLHSQNKHKERYNFKQLIQCCAELKQHVLVNKFGNESINFFDASAVKALNKALLKYYYAIDFWDIPLGYLCPPIPGRADYIHNLADILNTTFKNKTKNQIKILDIGVGANCVYPIIGNAEYGWQFVGTDIDKFAIESATKIITNNPHLQNKIELRLQVNPKFILKNIIKSTDFFEATICNPPFHSSQQDAQRGSDRKTSNLKKTKITNAGLNFGGKNNELWCNGGEVQFLKTMILESAQFAKNVGWFSSLVSKQTTLASVYFELKQVNAYNIKTIEMEQGNKISRLVAWTFLNEVEQQNWNQKTKM